MKMHSQLCSILLGLGQPSSHMWPRAIHLTRLSGWKRLHKLCKYLLTCLLNISNSTRIIWTLIWCPFHQQTSVKPPLFSQPCLQCVCVLHLHNTWKQCCRLCDIISIAFFFKNSIQIIVKVVKTKFFAVSFYKTYENMKHHRTISLNFEYELNNCVDGQSHRQHP